MRIDILTARAALAAATRDHPLWAAGIGVGMILTGVLSLLSPAFLGVAAMVTVGLLLIIGGVGQCIWAMQTGSAERGWLVFVLGGVAVIVGFFLVLRPITALTPVIILVAVYFALTGVGTIVHALAIQPKDGWAWMLAGGAFSVLLALLVIAQWPFSGVWAVGVLIGLQLIVSGVSLARMGFTQNRRR